MNDILNINYPLGVATEMPTVYVNGVSYVTYTEANRLERDEVANAPAVVNTVEELRDLDAERFPGFIAPGGMVCETEGVQTFGDERIVSDYLPATVLAPVTRASVSAVQVAQTVRFPCEEHDSEEHTEVPNDCPECDAVSLMVVRQVLDVAGLPIASGAEEEFRTVQLAWGEVAKMALASDHDRESLARLICRATHTDGGTCLAHEVHLDTADAILAAGFRRAS
ncbi:hypothetical protein [Demequina sp. SO4-18]|uniref:hypothetical protein n=1 Tax=Demequina sp. SO4-18 TaxID=3401026 RepID=UPI003B5901CA